MDNNIGETAELNEAAQIYLENRQLIEKARADFEKYADGFDKSIVDVIKSETFGNMKVEYERRHCLGEGGKGFLEFFKKSWVTDAQKNGVGYPYFSYRIVYDKSKRFCEFEDEEVALQPFFYHRNPAKDNGDLEALEHFKKTVTLNFKDPDQRHESVQTISCWINGEDFKSSVNEREIMWL